MLIKSTQWKKLRFFPKACTRIFNNIKYWLQGLQIGAFQQRYLKCKFKTPYFEGELVPKTCKNWKMSSDKIFLSGLVTKLEDLFVFGKNLWKISSNWWFQKKLLTDLTSAQTLKVCYKDSYCEKSLTLLSVWQGPNPMEPLFSVFIVLSGKCLNKFALSTAANKVC